MKSTCLWLSTAAALACALPSITMAAVVPVTGITGHDGGNYQTTLGHLTDMVNALNPGWATGTLTYTRRNPALNTGVSYSYQWTDSLAQGSWQAFTPSNVAASGASPVESVTITLPAGLLSNTKLFVRVVATSN